MHNPKIEAAAAKYLAEIPGEHAFSRGSVGLHMVAFAEQVLKDFGRGAEPVADGPGTAPSARGNNETSNVSATAGTTPDVASNFEDDQSYQRWLSEVASTCRARDKPCGGCQAGGICDGDLGFGKYEDDEPIEFEVEDIEQ